MPGISINDVGVYDIVHSIELTRASMPITQMNLAETFCEIVEAFSVD